MRAQFEVIKDLTKACQVFQKFGDRKYSTLMEKITTILRLNLEQIKILEKSPPPVLIFLYTYNKRDFDLKTIKTIAGSENNNRKTGLRALFKGK